MTEPTFADHATQEPTQEPVADNQDNVISVGDRNFNDLDDLTKSWANAQEHIKTLESEAASNKEALAKAKGIDEVLERIQSKSAEGRQTDLANAVSKEYLTEDTLNKVLMQRELDKQASSNVDQAMKHAKAELGTEYVAKLDAKAEELGMPVSDAIEIAKSSPIAFSKLFMDKAPAAVPNSGGDINSAAIPPAAPDAPSMRVAHGAPSRDVIAAWNAAKPKLE